MTDDLIARLRWHDAAVADDVFQADHNLYGDAADALEALMGHAEAMAKALTRVSDIVDRNLYRQHEKIEDVPKIARPIEDAYRTAFPEPRHE